jgi:hypothetical protein
MRTPSRLERCKQLLQTEHHFVVVDISHRLDLKNHKPKFHFAMFRFLLESPSRRLKQEWQSDSRLKRIETGIGIVTVLWIVDSHARTVPGIDDSVLGMKQLGRDMP